MSSPLARGAARVRRLRESLLDVASRCFVVDLLSYVAVGLCCMAVGLLAHAFEVSSGAAGQDRLSLDILVTVAEWLGPYLRGNWGGLVELALFVLMYLCSVKYPMGRGRGGRHSVRGLLALRGGRPFALLALTLLSLLVLAAYAWDLRDRVLPAGLGAISSSAVASLMWVWLGAQLPGSPRC